MNDPRLITRALNPDAKLPKGEPIAKAPQAAPETCCDPRQLLVTRRLCRPEDADVGDWVAAEGWTRPRRVEFIDMNGDEGTTLFLADPDQGRTNEHGVRRLNVQGWLRRVPWRRYPNLKRLWDAAHGGS